MKQYQISCFQAHILYQFAVPLGIEI